MLIHYVGYVTRSRRQNRKKQQANRGVFHCFVFGPSRAGKTALLKAFLGRPFTNAYVPITGERYAVNFVEGTEKTLVLREISEDRAINLLSNEESLAGCDVANFVHDRSDEASWKRATELLVEVARHGEVTRYEVPCLMVAAKGDLAPFPMATQDYNRVSHDMGIEAPTITVSAGSGDLNNLFRRIVGAAENPHLSIPETRRRKHYNLVKRVGAAVAVVGLAAYWVYAARKNSSS